ncbi:uncharacterized protein LOC116126678 isoform X2 [Pistacia vera]|uniref:uncharacterized protein LOC116126678 isoform X2 n=1 Tax=Pistacia vera TaxID=55513 RepID=UPI001263CB74|nr:uncharacterized protein LOC116126678 isoform X2 [Pistacia vera]
MEDPSLVSASSRNCQMSGVVGGKKGSQINLVASTPKAFSQSNCRHIALLSRGKNISVGAAGHIAIFLLKVAALEAVRRVSKAKCPNLWRGLQALQVICYPPFKWIQRWAPFKGLIRGMQMLSRPLLLLSIAETVSELSECSDETSDVISGSHANSESPPDLSSMHSPTVTSCDEGPTSLTSENWSIKLSKELENQGIYLPERLNEDELHRFYTAANGDFSCFLALIKKTIRWRETYRILSEEELQTWSDMVFWHGFDVQHRPCLIVRLGLACYVMPSHDRPRFAQAIISQVEHGVLHLVKKANNPQITVLVDCDGLSPLRMPMQIIRSCSSLLQDHYPNLLGCLLVIRLPPVVRVITQTFVQILKPVTRKKVKIEGEMYRKVLSEYFETLPSYLGGNCSCMKCSSVGIRDIQRPSSNETSKTEPYADISDDENLSSPRLSHHDDINVMGNCDQVLRTAVIGILMFWVLIALIVGMTDPESRPF